MKAILLLDTDEIRPDCAGCMAHYITTWGEEHPHRCEAAQRRLPDDCEEKKPEWCPLKKAPERKKAAYPTAYEKIDTPDEWEIYRTGFEDGFNDCLDAILEKEN